MTERPVQANQGGVVRSPRFLPHSPFEWSREHAAKHGCELAVPNGSGIGNVTCFTRLVEEFARSIGRPIHLLTAPLRPAVGAVNGEAPFPIWMHNPFIERVVNADELDSHIMQQVNREQDNLCQFSHVITNICACYGLRPRALRPSLFLSTAEMRWALQELADTRRPIVALHPAGKSSPSPDSPWHQDRWIDVIDTLRPECSFVQLGHHAIDDTDLGLPRLSRTLRQTMALVWASDVFLGFDSSIAHFATAFEKPATVLWDPCRKIEIEEPAQPGFGAAAMLRWSYPQNTNVILLGEKRDEIVGIVRRQIREQLRSFKVECDGAT